MSNPFKLFSNSNPKMAKSVKFGYFSVILHLAPSGLSGVNQCPFATKGCIKSCLNTAGHGAFNSVQTARINRTQLMLNNPELFNELLVKDIQKAIKIANKNNLTLTVRLDGTSDKDWSYIVKQFPMVQFYDYTKDIAKALNNKLSNYHLTFSRSENNHDDCLKAIAHGINVAVVFYKKLPENYMGLPVIDGDINDLRFLDSSNKIIGLLAKGKAKKDDTGFTVRL
jgi:hypothetical protein